MPAIIIVFLVSVARVAPVLVVFVGVKTNETAFPLRQSALAKTSVSNAPRFGVRSAALASTWPWQGNSSMAS